jgi:hypothetical protein
MKKKVSFREKDVGGPPEHSAWVWHTMELKRSPAWKGASINLLRLLNYLELEHLRHERKQNGDLLALYDDLVRFGITRGLILSTIREGEKRGLIEVEHVLRPRNGKRPPTRFRLTYLPTCSTDPKTKVVTWHRETDEWRRYVEPKRSGQPESRFKGRTAKNVFTRSEQEPKSVPIQELGSESDSSVSAKNQVLFRNRKSVPIQELPLHISGQRGMAARPRRSTGTQRTGCQCSSMQRTTAHAVR